MNFDELKLALAENPDCALQLEFENGATVPPHFHVTEVGHVTKDFIDCGGTRRTNASCVLQTLVAHDVDHRLSSTRLTSILNLTGSVLPSEKVPVEIEVDQGTTAVYSLSRINVKPGVLHLQLQAKHTACLAPDKCGLEDAPEEVDTLGSSPANACDPAANC